MSAPADPYRLTRQTFRLARLPIPDPIAWPLAWLTTRVYLRPRGHTVEDISACRAAGVYRGPLLLIHGSDDVVVPASHLERLAAAARAARGPGAPPVETLVVPGGQHSWLYESPAFRRTVAGFFARSLDGPLTPDAAADRAEAVPATRLPDPIPTLSAAEAEPGGLRSLASLARNRMRDRTPPPAQTASRSDDPRDLAPTG
jgi:hypothetical protein